VPAHPPRTGRAVLTLLTLAYTGFVCRVTMDPTPPDVSSGTSTVTLALDRLAQHPATAWITFDLVEFLANVAMFVPFGLLVVLLVGSRRWWLAVLAGALFTGVIESVQGLFLPARVADPSDLVANTLGALIGAVIALGAQSLRASRSRTDGRRPGRENDERPVRPEHA
jgi:VanZ family protein